MKKLFYSVAFFFFMYTNLFSQSIAELKISSEELPKEYAMTKETQCKSVHACAFYKQTDLYSSFLGKVKSKEIQNFQSKKDSGSIMYFEFERDFEADEFLKGLLWGSQLPSKSHPEEFIAKGKFLIIYSFEKDSELKKLAQDKQKLLLN
ncbi:hypothetical protein [Flavobacterium sedimenticola]|uniref:Uncharacterized protein n=1 Tax=Flavobacterium sedimenticola TaxID=3043286 RepID=A0ABT6XPH5_9FLAO|nr:hypothetical protein [Flavobacterium sedimenticola]MDI9256882.1 hypothetical protein [Flavobacterium sedimenticola]